MPGLSSKDAIYYDQARLSTLSLLLMSRIDEVLSELGVRLSRTSRMYYGACPIHGGDKTDSINIYRGGNVPGKWQCWTHHCEHTFKKTIIGFIRGCLSHEKWGWQSTGDKTVSFNEAVDWSCRFLGQSFKDIRVDYVDLEKRKFVSLTDSVALRSVEQSGLTRADVVSRLSIPSPYFIQRGFSEHVLRRYDVGFCSDPKKRFYQRAVVPIYDEDYRFALGFTARSVFDRCGKCRLWHDQNRDCPGDHERMLFSKWTNSEGFAAERHLYNYWFSKQSIRRDGFAIVVEGPGKIWRLHEAGIEHGVAAFGNDLSDQQQILLEMSGAMTLIVVGDNDDGGEFLRQKVKKEMGRSYRLFFPIPPKNDIEDLTPAETKEFLLPYIQKAKSW